MEYLIRSRVERALDGMLGRERLGAIDVKRTLASVSSDIAYTHAKTVPRGFSVSREVRKVGYGLVRNLYERGTSGNWKLK
tara:strand:+ start:374 stop:613 length:240 start_codon:yes stop_codon:yes gene_type:complete